MAYGCPICSESLERSPNEELRDAGGISAAPCGHVFHKGCINQWLQGSLANSSKCPCCRKNIPKLICIPLFPTLHDDTILDDSINRIPCDHEPIIRELRKNVEQLKIDLSVLETVNASTTSELQTMRSKLLIEEHKAQRYIEKCTILKSRLSYEGELEKKFDKANSELECLKSLRDALEAVKSDRELEAEEIHWPVNQNSIDNLIGMKLTLTRELRSQMQIIKNKEADKEKIRSENGKLRNELRQVKKNHEQVVDENANLKIEIDFLKQQLSENGVNIHSDEADESIMYLTPMKKRKAVQQVPQSMSIDQDDSVIEIPPPDIDQDVGLLEAFHNRKIKSNKSPINCRKNVPLQHGVKKSTNYSSTRNPGLIKVNNKSSNSINSNLDKNQQSSSNATTTTTSNNIIPTTQSQNKSNKNFTLHTKAASGLSILKRKKLHGSFKSADDVLNTEKSSSSGSSSSGVSKSSNSLSTLKEDITSYEDLSPLDFRANIKSSWPGLTDTPIGIAASSRLNAVVGRGISRPPKIIKK